MCFKYLFFGVAGAVLELLLPLLLESNCYLYVLQVLLVWRMVWRNLNAQPGCCLVLSPQTFAVFGFLSWTTWNQTFFVFIEPQQENCYILGSVVWLCYFGMKDECVECKLDIESVILGWYIWYVLWAVMTIFVLYPWEIGLLYPREIGLKFMGSTFNGPV